MDSLIYDTREQDFAYIYFRGVYIYIYMAILLCILKLRAPGPILIQLVCSVIVPNQFTCIFTVLIS
jgi:hypothetical protein